jgi:hypothetical protein
MGSSNNKGTRNKKDSEMSAHLTKSGYPHGRRKSVTNAPCVPNMKDTGSAAYRRRNAK